MADGELLLGVAGWSYEDWKDVVYPRSCRDTLRAVAQRVDLIEINSTFYGLPTARNCSSWVERTADLGTRFTAKLPQQFTHVRQYDSELVAQVRHGFAPLVGSGRLVGLLAQFNHEFHHDAGAIAYLRRLATDLGGDAPLFVEVRHRSWNAEEALAAMRALGIGVLALDYPGMVGGFSRDVPGVLAAGTAYFRLHGRNRAWFLKGAGRDEVYDWLYSPREVGQIAQRIERLRAGADRTAVVANNHFHGKAMRLIADLMAWYREAGS